MGKTLLSKERTLAVGRLPEVYKFGYMAAIFRTTLHRYTQDSARMLPVLSVLASPFEYSVLTWSLLDHHSVWPTIL